MAPPAQSFHRALAACLAIVIVALMIVGVVSATVIRHAIQVVAPALALVALRRGAPWSPYAALPIFLFWLWIMTLIWLYLLGLSDFASGSYSLIERALTAVIALACLFGLGALVRARPRVNAAAGAVSVLGFAALQWIVMWLSFQPAVQNR